VELNLGFRIGVEAVIVVLQGLMSSEVELVQGCDRGCDRFRLAKLVSKVM